MAQQMTGAEMVIRALADWQREPGRPVLEETDTRRLLVLPDRAVLAGTIDARFDAMVAAGALEEVRALLALGFSDELPVMRALGVAPLVAHLAGRTPLEEAMAQAKADTRQYAKRQVTWFRRNIIAWKTIRSEEMERIDRLNFAFIDS